MAKASQPGKVPFRQRLGQTWQAIRWISKQDRAFAPLALISLIVPLAVAIVLVVLGIGWGFVSGPSLIALGLIVAMIGFMIVLYLRSNKAMISQVRGQTGGAVQLATTLRGDWRIPGLGHWKVPGFPDGQPRPLAMTMQQDAVWLLIGRPGVVLIGEGNPARVRGLINQEKRRLVKVIGTTDLRDFVIGDEEGQLPLEKLRSTLTRLPRSITAKDVNSLQTRMQALLSRPTMPKGAIPKNMRPPRGQFRMTRGR